MTGFTDDDVDRWCRILHDAYEESAQLYGWPTQAVSRVAWDDVPEANKQTMRAAVRAVAPAIASRTRLKDADDLAELQGGKGWSGSAAQWLRAQDKGSSGDSDVARALWPSQVRAMKAAEESSE